MILCIHVTEEVSAYWLPSWLQMKVSNKREGKYSGLLELLHDSSLSVQAVIYILQLEMRGKATV